ncbi:hypothetical protein CsSME_00029064 [Camellia sinensis var. sinensis]
MLMDGVSGKAFNVRSHSGECELYQTPREEHQTTEY